jgi:hypothetical protein
MLKIYNALNGAFYVFYGVFGAFMPKSMAGLMGWDPSLLGLHQIRAVWLLLAGLGAMCLLYTAKLSDQKPMTLAIIFATLSILGGRCLGLIFDGAGPGQTYFEMGLEVFIIGLGVFLYKRA